MENYKDIKKTKTFKSIGEESSYYKSEYEKLKIENSKLKEENKQLIENNKKIMENLKKERQLRKELEEKDKYRNIENPVNSYNPKYNDLFEKMNLIFVEEEDELEENEEDIVTDNINNNEEINNDNPFINLEKEMDNNDSNNINNEKKYNNLKMNEKENQNEKKNEIIIKDINNNNKINDENNLNNINEKPININDSKFIIFENNKKNEKENKTDNNNEKKFDIEDEKSLSEDFIIYGKDTIPLRNSINTNELKIHTIYTILKKWKNYFAILKKGAYYFNKSITLFNEHLSLYSNQNNSNLLKEFPFILKQISILQKCFSTINIYSSSLITTIDSSCSIQINNLITNYFKTQINLRKNIIKKNNELLSIQNKYLTTKRNKKEKDSIKEKYYTEYKNIELMKYDYCFLINKIIMIIKLKIPEIISLLTYYYTIFFSNIKDELNELNQIVRDNLENILDKMKIKDNIEKKMNNNKKSIMNNILTSIDNTLKTKEGFLNMKDIETNKFVKRYVKIINGKIVYYKINKVNSNENSNNKTTYLNMNEKIDTSECYEVCNLLFSNAKKVDKLNYYPFCFEIINANTRKTYKFQADTEYELEEWLIAITNAISEQIINFDEKTYQNKNDDKNNINNKNDKQGNNLKDLTFNSSQVLNDKKDQKKQIEKLINENICSDCGAQKPTWLSINWLTMICIDCSSIHRSLGVQISKIKSLELDNISEEYIELLSFLKQSDINRILEQKLIEEKEKPKFNSSREEKEQFIINKYKEKKYINKEKNEPNKIIEDIFKSIESNDLLNIYKLIKSSDVNINKLYIINGNEYGFIHHCAKLGMMLSLKLLFIMGADNHLRDPKGLKSIDYAIQNMQVIICEYLKEKEEIDK